MSIKIYLSPSNQVANRYAVGGTNEKTEMEEIAKRIKDILDAEYECETFISPAGLTISRSGRPMDAKNKGCKVYIAIHSNAGGNESASGAEGYYHPGSALSKALASRIVEELGKISPIKSNRTSPLQSGMSPFLGKGFAEVREPHSLGMVAVLAETDFHDNPMTAEWIINNKSKIARAYVKAITNTFDIKEKIPSKPQDSTKEILYRVQVGVFSKRENAVNLLKELERAGFKGIIKQE